MSSSTWVRADVSLWSRIYVKSPNRPIHLFKRLHCLDGKLEIFLLHIFVLWCKQLLTRIKGDNGPKWIWAWNVRLLAESAATIIDHNTLKMKLFIYKGNGCRRRGFAVESSVTPSRSSVRWLFFKDMTSEDVRLSVNVYFWRNSVYIADMFIQWSTQLRQNTLLE